MGTTIRRPGNNGLVKVIQGLVDHGLENVGMYYSIYRAFVANVEDPENLQRLELIIPQVSGNQAYNFWAYPIGVFAGPGYGMQVLPKKGDMVWVQFEGGKPEIPVWSHGHPARRDMPEGDGELKQYDCYWFVSPTGHKVKINDTKNTIHIYHRDGQYVEINENSISSVSDKQISLGTLDQSKYKAVLGEPIEDLLKDINKYIKDMHTAFNKDIAMWTARGFVNTAAEIPLQLTRVAGLAAKLDKILSKKVTLD